MKKGSLVSKIVSGAVLAGSCLIGGLYGFGNNSANAEEMAAGDEDKTKVEVVSGEELSDHPWDDGLYSTITGALMKVPRLQGVKNFRANVRGMKEPIGAVGIAGDKNAPLVFMINGTSSPADNGISRMWGEWLRQKGYNVLTWDSTMHPKMAKIWGGGVLGNLEKEAEINAVIMEDLIKHEGLNPEKIGIIGVSYGGIESLLISRRGAQGKLGFRMDKVQAYASPVSMRETLDILDRNFKSPPALSELAWEFGFLSRQKGMLKDFDREHAAIAISRIFYMDLANIVLNNDDFYGGAFEKLTGKNRLIPKFEYDGGNKVECDKDRRKDYADAVSFGMYVNRFLAPYWKARGYNEDILAQGELNTLLNEVGDNTEVVLTRNDPLNEPGAVDKLRDGKYRTKIVILPRGGHMGNFDCMWMKKHIQGIFDDCQHK